MSGADIIDIGGESTRPGSKIVSQKNELQRVKNIVKNLKKNFLKLYYQSIQENQSYEFFN